MYNYRSLLRSIEAVIVAWSVTNLAYPRTTPQIFADPRFTQTSARIANHYANTTRRMMIPSDPPFMFSGGDSE